VCGRFVRVSPYVVISEAFLLSGPALERGGSFNIAPGQDIAAVVAGPGGRRLEFFRWGFVPAWGKDPKASTINARSETVAVKPSFRDALRKRRCLLIADGFYEWHKGRKKRPFYITRHDGRPFGMAGIYETSTLYGAPRTTCAIITVPANKLIEPLHDRMPAIIAGGEEGPWLDCGGKDLQRILGALRPFPAEEMKLHEVAPLVNSPFHDFARCIEPVSESS